MTNIILPREVCGISFFYIVETKSPFNREDEDSKRDALAMWLDMDASNLLPECVHEWPYKGHSIEITIRAVFAKVLDLTEINELLKEIITRSGYFISEPIGDEHGNS